jgi:hypothetical protein
MTRPRQQIFIGTSRDGCALPKGAQPLPPAGRPQAIWGALWQGDSAITRARARAHAAPPLARLHARARPPPGGLGSARRSTARGAQSVLVGSLGLKGAA